MVSQSRKTGTKKRSRSLEEIGRKLLKISLGDFKIDLHIPGRCKLPRFFVWVWGIVLFGAVPPSPCHGAAVRRRRTGRMSVRTDGNGW